MKTGVHPAYYPTAKVTCACGHSFTVGSTVEAISVELCSKCHPFYTGHQRIVDTARRVDKFQRRVEAQAVVAPSRQGRRVKLAAKTAKRQLKVDESKKRHARPHAAEA